ncbi:RICIN domain-containing protein [Dactylosporangium siamense]|uniref:Ricin B lectin domain-containing protein n=1 Tax=Dactylosporangium siamense TaxID=685454 RepID=A0A919UE66_9ACTN|nr:RICIN domain-containing protein [Dactylosporangium siamense]GIG52242.1 hypothetical protein Dsi01nite_102830 [Dactylosporangium siamense]
MLVNSILDNDAFVREQDRRHVAQAGQGHVRHNGPRSFWLLGSVPPGVTSVTATNGTGLIATARVVTASLGADAPFHLTDTFDTAPACGSSGTGAIIGNGSNRCIDIPAANAVDGNRLQIWDCNGASNQKWH